MIGQKTYDFKGTKLIKLPIESCKCTGCFFEWENCIPFQPNCTKGIDDNETNVIFIEAKNEIVNKID